MAPKWGERLAYAGLGAMLVCAAQSWAAVGASTAAPATGGASGPVHVDDANSAAMPPPASVAAADGLYRKLEVLAEVFGQIENHYVDAISPTDLIYGAARGALSVLDPHSTFFSPEEYKSLLDSTEGEYAGIGIEMDMPDGLPEIISVFDDSPAAKAGVLASDQIVAIDGREVEGMDFDAVERLLRGPVGSKVVLVVHRGAHNAALTYTLVRGWVRVAPLAYKPLPKDVGYVQIKSFSRRVASDLEAQVLKKPPKGGLVIDLRGNPGGLFDEAVAVCDLFLADGPIVAAVGRGGVLMEQQVAHAHGTQPNYKIAVLIDQGSASAAEIVAGALRDRGRARLFGSRSYGKGSVQSILDLTDGSGLKLTIARYLTPSGKQIDGHGVEPDVEVRTEPTQSPGSDADKVLAVALSYLNGG